MSAHDWLDVEAVATHLGGTVNDSTVTWARNTAAAYVERVRADLFTEDGPALSDDITGGAMLLAARLYARKGSPQGLASFGEFGPGAILRLDPDIERLLGLGRNARPRVG